MRLDRLMGASNSPTREHGDTMADCPHLIRPKRRQRVSHCDQDFRWLTERNHERFNRPPAPCCLPPEHPLFCAQAECLWRTDRIRVRSLSPEPLGTILAGHLALPLRWRMGQFNEIMEAENDCGE